jgi:hypothetical protein
MGVEHAASTTVHGPNSAKAVPRRTPPTGGEDTSVDVFSAEPNVETIAALQRSHGNQFVARTLANRKLQRHPEGFEPGIDPEAAAQELAQPESSGVETSPAAESESADLTPSETAPKGAKPTAPAKPKAMSLAKAEEVLTASFGKVKKIVPGKIEILADRKALWAKYDEINKGRGNPYNGGKPWEDGDAKKYIPGLDGTANPDTGTVYVNDQTTLATATAHEVLHNNTAAGFRKAVGETINEGATEYLAIKALKAAKVSIKSGTAYPGEVGFVTKLIEVVTEKVLIDSYFGGATTLTDAYDKAKGTGAFDKLKPLADAKNYTEAGKLLKAEKPK